MAYGLDAGWRVVWVPYRPEQDVKRLPSWVFIFFTLKMHFIDP